MGRKNLLGLAGLVIAGATLSGCASSRPQTNGPLMSGTPSMMGAAQQQGATNMGLAQNQNQNQTRGWNDRGTAASGNSPTGMMPAGATAGNQYGAGTFSNSAPRTNTGSMGAGDKSYLTPSTYGTPNTYSRGSTTPAYPTGTSTAYPRSTTAMPGNDRMLTSPSVPNYPSSTSSSIGSAMQPSTSKTGSSGTSVPPPPAPVSATSPQFGSGSTSSGPTFTPQGGSNE